MHSEFFGTQTANTEQKLIDVLVEQEVCYLILS
jgi:hypothetical protein